MSAFTVTVRPRTDASETASAPQVAMSSAPPIAPADVTSRTAAAQR